MNKAIILAAGNSSRLQKYLKGGPKQLIKINQLTIIEHLVNKLKKLNIKKIVLVTGFQSKKIKKVLKQKVRYIFYPNFKITNNLHTLLHVKDELNQSLLCLFSDVIFDLEILRKLKDSKKDICLAVDKKSRLNGTMRIKTRKNYVVDIGNQIKTKQSSGNFIGFAKFSKKGCDNIKKNLVKYKFSNYRDYYTFALKGLMKNNKVYFEDFSGYYWKEIDTYKDLIQAKKINNEIEKKEKEKI